MAQFNNAYYTYTKPFEGGYANVTGDKGGETYAGIARNFFPNENIWSFIDRVKQSRPIKHNEHFVELDNDVTNFYKRIWDKNRLGEINSQAIANLLFDYIVHSGSGKAVKAIQNIVGAVPDGIIGPNTLAKINASLSDVVFSKLLEERTNFLKSLAEKPGQNQFFDGWMNRMKKFATDFNDLLTTHRGITAIAAFIVAFIFLYLII